MKRIQSACLEQTVHFELNKDIAHSEAVSLSKRELDSYKTNLERRHARFKIVEETTLPDGSFQIKIKKQYNSYDCGNYID